MGDDFFMDFSFFAHRFFVKNLWKFILQMGNPLGVYETNYKVKKVVNLSLGKIWPPSDLLFLEWSYCSNLTYKFRIHHQMCAADRSFTSSFLEKEFWSPLFPHLTYSWRSYISWRSNWKGLSITQTCWESSTEHPVELNSKPFIHNKKGSLYFAWNESQNKLVISRYD